MFKMTSSHICLGITVLTGQIISIITEHSIGQWQPMWLNQFPQVKRLLGVSWNFEPSLSGPMLTRYKDYS